MPYKDPEKRREYMKRYRFEHLQQIREYEQQWRDGNRGSVREKIRRWKKANPDKVKADYRQYYAANKEKIIEKDRKYVSANREKVNAKMRRWNAKNPEKVAAKHARWAKTHPETDKRLKRQWANANPEKIRTSHLKRHFGLTEAEYQELFKKQGGVCAICGCDNNGKSLDVDHDHKTGVIRGLLCRKCNSGIGHLRDDINLIENALNYLRQYSNDQSPHLA